MRTAKLKTRKFTIQCPHCEALQTEPAAEPQEGAGAQEATEAREFTAQDVAPAQEMKCTAEACRKLFRLPTKLQAEAE